MVFTRKRQAEDDAAQVNEVDEACSTAASSDTLPTAGSTINITAALTAQNGESVSASISMSTTTVPRVSDPQGNTSTAPAATKVSGKGRKKSTKGNLLSTPSPESDSDFIKVHLVSRRSKRKAMTKIIQPTTIQVQMGK